MRLLQVRRRAMKVDPSLVQIGDVVGDLKRAFHIVRHHDAGHAEPLL